MSQHNLFPLPRLPYASGALEPKLNRATLLTHHDRLFAACTQQLNRAMEPWTNYHSWSLRRILLQLDELPRSMQDALGQSAGCYYNHSLYFASMAPPRTTRPGRRLLAAAEREFGSMGELLRLLRQAAHQLTGEGYVWLCCTSNGRLVITTTHGEMTPLPLRPLVCIDLYRHAYALTYGDDRAAYIDAFLTLLNWDAASQRYEAVFAREVPWPRP